MHTYSLFDLNEHVRRVIALNFGSAVWITAEVAQASRSRGQMYLDLVQKGTEIMEEDQIVAQSQGIVWAKDYQRLLRQHGTTLDALLSEGTSVRLQVRVEFHERYGLKLHIEDVDPVFTYGQLAMIRQQTIERLRQSYLLGRNAALPLPAVLQRIAVISSPNAAGLQDFLQHLQHNAWGYRFHLTYFYAAVQGKNAETELIAALESVREQYRSFDCVVVIRGGGAKLDLVAFDSFLLCQAVAMLPLPLLSGIGHDVDETVLDLVAHRALKTPTAVADSIVERNLQFEQAILTASVEIRRAGIAITQQQSTLLQRTENNLQGAARLRLQSARFQLDHLSAALTAGTAARIYAAAQFLDRATAICRGYDPAEVLRRGYSVTLKEGQVVRNAKELEAGDVLETRLSEGVVWSKVEPR